MTPRENTISIRSATVDDCDLLVELVRGLARYEKLEDQVTATAGNLREYGFGEESYFKAVIATDTEGTALGFALYFFTFSTFIGHPCLWLEDLFVNPEARGRGIGLDLLKHLAKIAIKKECQRMEWNVLDWNEPAINFYKKLGATAQDEWSTYRLDREAIIQLGK